MRSSAKLDLRVLTLDFYNLCRFGVVAGFIGDCFDRYLVRLNEMLESCKILLQSLYYLVCGSIINSTQNSSNKNYSALLFVFYESPKGETLLSVAYLGSRSRIRSADYFSLSIISVLAHNQLLADLIAVIGTLDFVLGSVDR